MNDEKTEQRIVLLFGSGIDVQRSTALASESSQLALILRNATGPVEVSVISLGLSQVIGGASKHIRLDESGRGFADHLFAAFGAFAVRTWFASFPLGRLLNSLGPVDGGRVFWRTMKRHPEALRLLKTANWAIATDLAATKTAWLAVHRGWVDEASYDRRSASLGISL